MMAYPLHFTDEKMQAQSHTIVELRFKPRRPNPESTLSPPLPGLPLRRRTLLSWGHPAGEGATFGDGQGKAGGGIQWRL